MKGLSLFKKLILLFLLLSIPSLATAESVQNYIVKGNQRVKEHRYEEAIKQYEEALKIEPKNHSVHLVLGLSYAQTGNLEKALQHAKKAAESAPSFAAFYNLGLIHAKKNEAKKAIESFDQALKFSPGSYLAEYQKGMVQASEKRYGEAVKSFQRAIQSHPRFADAYVSLGGAYYHSGDKAAALKQVKELRKLKEEEKAVGLERWIEEKESGKPI